MATPPLKGYRRPDMISSRHLFTALLALVALSCAPAPISQSFTAPAAVFDGERARELTEQCSRPSPGPVEGVWTPSEAQIAAMEPALRARIDEELTQANVEEDPSEYIRQYGGLIIGGKRVIYTHGFLQRIDDPDEAWRTHPMVICDGGPITFGVEYDPATQTFANFAFNGGF